MKFFALLLGIAFISELAISQTPYKPKKRKKDFFGKQYVPSRNVGNWAVILGAGPSFSKASDNSLQEDIQLTDQSGNLYNVAIDQKGKIGGNASFSFAYFSKKPGWFSFGRLIDYYALGVGFHYYRGSETTNLTDAAGRDVPALSGTGDYRTGLLSGRFGMYKTQPIPGTKLFGELGLVAHAEYALIKADQSYTMFVPNFAYYSPSFTAQANVSLGIGFQLKKGSYLIPSVFAPVFSFADMGKEAVHWFDSRYYPINCQLKWIYRLNKAKSKTNCTTPDKGPMPPPPAEGQK